MRLSRSDGPPRRRGWGGVMAAALLAIPGPASPIAGQSFSGLVADQLTLDPVAGAVVVLYRSEAERLIQSALTTTDSAGAFDLAVPGPGVYRVQADLRGLSSPLSHPVDLRGLADRGEVALLLPSPLLRAALSCQDDAGEGSAAIVGTLLEDEAGLALPRVPVAATWREGGTARRQEVETDPAGRFRLCPPGGVGPVAFETLIFGSWRGHGSLDVDRPSIFVHDLVVEFSTSARVVDVVREQVLQEAAVRTLGDLAGELRDALTGAPLPFAVVTLRDTPHQAEAGADGRFSFAGLTAGVYVLEVRSLGYSVDSEPLELGEGQAVFLRMEVAPQAVEIAGVEVTARTAAEEAVRATPFRRGLVYGERMAEEERRGATAFEILRRSGPGISVRERYTEYGPTLCIEANRRLQSLDGGCDNAQVVVDGVRIHDGAEFLHRTPASQLESIEFVTPVQAQTLYGIFGDSSNGVVVVYTRGIGPYASPLRNGGR